MTNYFDFSEFIITMTVQKLRDKGLYNYRVTRKLFVSTMNLTAIRCGKRANNASYSAHSVLQQLQQDYPERIKVCKKYIWLLEK